MRRMTCAVYWLTIGVGLAAAFETRPGDPQKKLEGSWTATKEERDGKAVEDLVGHRLTLSGDRFEIKSKNGKNLYAGAVKLDHSAKPAAFDFEHTEGILKGKVWKGIFTLKGDTLTTCDNGPDPDKPRPTAFEAKQGSGYVLITFRRANR